MSCNSCSWALGRHAMYHRIALARCGLPLWLACRGTSGTSVCFRVARALLAGIRWLRIHLWAWWCFPSPRAATATSPEHSFESRLTTVSQFHLMFATPLTVAVSVPTDRIKHMGVLPAFPRVLCRHLQLWYHHAPRHRRSFCCVCLIVLAR
jgi:hypothetical protein